MTANSSSTVDRLTATDDRTTAFDVMSTTSKTRKTSVVVVVMTRQYSSRLIDNPLWLGLTLLAGIVFIAVVVVYVRRQTNKLLRQWTCDARCCCCCCRCRRCVQRVASGGANVSSNEVVTTGHEDSSVSRRQSSVVVMSTSRRSTDSVIAGRLSSVGIDSTIHMAAAVAAAVAAADSQTGVPQPSEIGSSTINSTADHAVGHDNTFRRGHLQQNGVSCAQQGCRVTGK